MARLKAERPGLVHIEALKQAGSNWKKSRAQYGVSSVAGGAQDGAHAAAGGSAPKRAKVDTDEGGGVAQAGDDFPVLATGAVQGAGAPSWAS